MTPHPQEDDSDRSLDAALRKGQRLLSVRERSSLELRERLTRNGFPEDVTDEAIERLSRSGLLSDSRFASSYIRGKLNLGWGEQRIAKELRGFGIDLYAQCGYPNDYIDDCSEVDRAREVIEKTTIHSAHPRQAVYRRLLSKGYSTDIAYRVAREYEENHPNR